MIVIYLPGHCCGEAVPGQPAGSAYVDDPGQTSTTRTGW